MSHSREVQPVKVGRLLEAGIGSFKVAVPVGQIDALAYGALVVVPVSADLAIYGVIADIAFESDPLTKVMAGAIEIPQSTFRSLRDQGASVEVSVFTVGHQRNGSIFHSLPPRPPLGLDELRPCSDQQVFTFTRDPLYLRNLLNRLDDPLVADLIAAHLALVHPVHARLDAPLWFSSAVTALIEENKNDPGLVRILLALQAILPQEVLA
jgi:hypothetical protein